MLHSLDYFPATPPSADSQQVLLSESTSTLLISHILSREMLRSHQQWLPPAIKDGLLPPTQPPQTATHSSKCSCSTTAQGSVQRSARLWQAQGEG